MVAVKVRQVSAAAAGKDCFMEATLSLLESLEG